MNIKIIGFDLDFTLYPYTDKIQERNRLQIYQDISSVFNIPIERAKELFEKFYSENNSGTKSLNLVAQELGEKVDGRMSIANSLNKANILELLCKDPKVIELLNYLKSKVEFVDLISSRDRNYGIKILNQLGINEDIFNATLFSNEHYSKSDGSIYRHWLSLRSVNPESHLYVGDLPKVDVDIPKKLGIKTCIIGNYKEADFSISNILGLYNIINQV